MVKKKFLAEKIEDEFMLWRRRTPKASLRMAWNAALAAAHARLAVECYNRCAQAPRVLEGLAGRPKATTVSWED